MQSNRVCVLVLQDRISKLSSEFEENLNLKKKGLKERNRRELNVNSAHKDQMRAKEATWDIKRPAIYSSVVSLHAFDILTCYNCRKEAKCVRCITCRTYLCFACDIECHTKQVLCDREICQLGSSLIPLLQHQFLNEFGEIITQGNCLFFHRYIKIKMYLNQVKDYI